MINQAVDTRRPVCLNFVPEDFNRFTFRNHDQTWDKTERWLAASWGDVQSEFVVGKLFQMTPEKIEEVINRVQCCVQFRCDVLYMLLATNTILCVSWERKWVAVTFCHYNPKNHPLFKVLGAGLVQSRIPWCRGEESGRTIVKRPPHHSAHYFKGQTTQETEEIEIE